MARGGHFDGYWYGRNGHFQNAHVNGRGEYNAYHSYHYGPPHGYTWGHENGYGYQVPQEKVGEFYGLKLGSDSGPKGYFFNVSQISRLF